MNRFILIRYSVLGKEIGKFWRLIRFSQQGIRLCLTAFLFLSLPGQNFYQTIRISAQPPLVRKAPFSLPTPAPYPERVGSLSPPSITASSAIVLDDESKVVLFAKNPKERLPPASLTKIVTALVALDHYNLDDVLVVRRLFSEGSQMGLFEGEKISVRNLLYGLLLSSGNDAGFTLADNISGGIEQFIGYMNKKVARLGLQDTHFTNPIGEDEQEHYSTAWDIAHLVSFAMKNSTFAQIVNTSHKFVSNYNQTQWHELENINILLKENLGVKGVKTGWTEKAGGCFAGFAQRGNRKIIVVVLGSKDKYTRFEDAKALIEWTFATYEWRAINH